MARTAELAREKAKYFKKIFSFSVRHKNRPTPGVENWPTSRVVTWPTARVASFTFLGAGLQKTGSWPIPF